MSDSYIIEVSSRAAGIVVRDKAGFRFFAAAPQFFRLEGQLFRSARDAERAAARFAGERDSNRSPPEGR
ncbi:MAG: hypothetical protein WBF99_13275 [Xanthobacteraceae bacterium]